VDTLLVAPYNCEVYVWSLLEEKLVEIYDQGELQQLLQGAVPRRLTYTVLPDTYPSDAVALVNDPANGWGSIRLVSPWDYYSFGNLDGYDFNGVIFPFNPANIKSLGVGNGFADIILLVQETCEGILQNALNQSQRIANARIAFLDKNDEAITEVVTDSDGTFSFPAHAERARMVGNAGFYNMEYNIPAPTTTAQLNLVPSSFDLTFFDTIFRSPYYGGMLQKFEHPTEIYIDTRTKYVAPKLTAIPQEWIEFAIDAANKVKTTVKVFENVPITIGDNPPVHNYDIYNNSIECPDAGVLWLYWDKEKGPSAASFVVGEDTNTWPQNGEAIHGAAALYGSVIPSEWKGIYLHELMHDLGAPLHPPQGTLSILDGRYATPNNSFSQEKDIPSLKVMEILETGNKSKIIDGKLIHFYDPKSAH
jgi:hypothetical protein